MTHSTRREFMMRTATTGTAMALLHEAAYARQKSPNEKLNIAIVGVANRGAANLEGVKGENIVALCDVDETYLAQAKAQFPKATTYNDYRKLLERGDIDAVVVSTPDHMHAPITLDALDSGRHVYCEKPLTRTVDEARKVQEMARRKKRVTQMGTQIHAENNYRRVVEKVKAGAIGPVREVHVWAGSVWSGKQRPLETPPVPSTLHWNLWLGVAPVRPYHPKYHPAAWRGFWDFGGGGTADMACHHMDLPFWALDLQAPTNISAEGVAPHTESAPAALTVRYLFPARGSQPPVHLTWYSGEVTPTPIVEGKIPAWGAGTLFVGERGMLLADYGRHLLLPESHFAGYQSPTPFIANSIGHHQEWIQAIKTGGIPLCNFDYAGPLTQTVLLGNVAYRSGRELVWDAARGRIVNTREADGYLVPNYRKNFG